MAAQLGLLDLAQLTPLDLEKKITVEQAAGINSVHPDTFKRNHPHLVRKVGLRAERVKLGDAINLPPPPE
jgi:hypothetical protein